MPITINGSGTITGASTLATTVASPTLTTPSVTSTLGVGGATPSASGAGITFPATQSASTDANTLDDYEEGTFTPSIAGTSTPGTATYAARVGQYVKVGRSVTFVFYVNWSGHTGTGNMLLTGLPFVANATGGVAARTDGIAMNANSYPMFSVEDGSSYILAAQTVVGTSNGANIPMDASGFIAIYGSYITTA